MACVPLRRRSGRRDGNGCRIAARRAAIVLPVYGPAESGKRLLAVVIRARFEAQARDAGHGLGAVVVRREPYRARRAGKRFRAVVVRASAHHGGRASALKLPTHRVKTLVDGGRALRDQQKAQHSLAASQQLSQHLRAAREGAAQGPDFQAMSCQAHGDGSRLVAGVRWTWRASA